MIPVTEKKILLLPRLKIRKQESRKSAAGRAFSPRRNCRRILSRMVYISVTEPLVALTARTRNASGFVLFYSSRQLQIASLG